MGSFVFVPEKGEEYRAVIDDFDGSPFKLPEAINKVRMLVDTSRDSFIVVSFWENKIQPKPVVYNLIGSAKGKIKFYSEIKMDKISKNIQLDFNKFEYGINKLTLADSLLRPTSERLVFVNNENLLSVTVKTHREEYSKREKVNVAVHTNTGIQGIAAHLSVSVVNQAQVIKLEKYPQNILSYLLLDS